MDKNEIRFLVQRLKNEPGKFMVMPRPESASSAQDFGLVPPEKVFHGTEEETCKYLTAKGESAFQIQALIDQAKQSPAK